MKKSFKEWYEKEARTRSVENYPSYRNWINSIDIEMACLLLKDNRKDFRKLYGPPSSVWTGEFRFDVWIKEFEGYKFVVLTAKTKGTCIEVVNGIGGAEAAINFSKFLINDLKSVKEKEGVIAINALKDICDEILEKSSRTRGCHLPSY